MNETEPTGPKQPSRFLTLDQVADELATTRAQAYALVRRKELRAIKLGGRGQWRVERTVLEEFITRAYAETEEFIDSHKFVEKKVAGSEAPE
jgi:excisionase family DNA binding protein